LVRDPDTINGSSAAATVALSSEDYDWRTVEREKQNRWEEARLFEAPELATDVSGCYICVANPSTSGCIHMGHIRSYTIADAYARYRRARGKPVLLSLGFDSFGQPTELEAIRHSVLPHQWVAECSRTIAEQLLAMGYSFDWGRSFLTCEEGMYRWTQALFLRLYEKDLIYRRNVSVDWCASCEDAVLPRSESEGDVCQRCGGRLHEVNRPQWFMRSSAYLSENDARLSELTRWSESTVGSQHAFLGRVDGVELPATTLSGEAFDVFTPYADAIPHAAFVALSIDYPGLEDWIEDGPAKREVEEVRSGDWGRTHPGTGVIPIVDLGLQASVPGVDHLLQVIVSPYVDARFGSTAVLGIPNVDTADESIAGRLSSTPALAWRVTKKAVPRRAVRYSAHDRSISRPRPWGSPIPIVHCADCGAVAVPVAELPIRLPQDLELTASGNALLARTDFVQCVCPRCGGPARREVETLDRHFDTLWTWLAPCVPRASRLHQMFDHPDLARWIPVEQAIRGTDGADEIASQRTATKMFRDAAVVKQLSDGEPFCRLMMHDKVRYGGRKTNGRLGNAVDPRELVDRVGADSLRFAILYAAAPRKGIDWNDNGLVEGQRFLDRLWRYARPRMQFNEVEHDQAIDISDRQRELLARWCDTAVARTTDNFETLQLHRATRNAMLLLERIEDFEHRVIAQRNALTDLDRQALAIALGRLLRLIAPITPHIAEELWLRGGNKPFLCTAPWPAVPGAAS
jgi:leucyl-tRNA synthetase